MTPPFSSPRPDVARRLPVGELDWDDLVDAVGGGRVLPIACWQRRRGGLVVAISGPAGVGKTFAVQVWAESMRLDLWRIDCPRLVARHGEGVSTRGLDEALAFGERPHAVLLFHDADALPQEAVAALLARAATRRAPTVLEARAERPDDVVAGLPDDVARVWIAFPDVELRRRHWERAVSRASPLSRPDLDALAALEVPGAVIDAAVRAVVLASGDERVETADLVAAVRELEA